MKLAGQNGKGWILGMPRPARRASASAQEHDREAIFRAVGLKLDTVNHYVHAYRMAPWRVQRQWIVTVMLAVVALALVASLYLDVTAQAGIAGRQIQDLASQTITVQQESADLQTQLASLTSASAMQRRALDLGYRPVDPEEVQYLVVPGYVAPQPDILSSIPQPQLSAPTIAPEYKQSLLDWLDEQWQTLGGMQ
jgi:hypothetical protein